MNVQSVNGVVLLPHAPDWRERVGWKRRWDTVVGETVVGKEERVALRPRGRVVLQYLLNPRDDIEGNKLLDRAREVMKTGRACCPFWGRGISLPFGATAGATVIDIGAEPTWEWDNGDPVFFAHPLPEQYDTFEVATLDRFKGDGKIRLTGALTLSYPAGSYVHPLLFGRAKVGDMELLDDWHKATSIDIEETTTRPTPDPDTT